MKPTLLIAFLLLTTTALSAATRKLNPNNPSPPAFNSDPGFFAPGFGPNIPGWGVLGGGYGAGYGGPDGGYAGGGTVQPSVVCKEKGPCYKKKLTCPAKCFSSYSRSGRNYGGGGGGGGCSVDCTKKCIAYC